MDEKLTKDFELGGGVFPGDPHPGAFRGPLPADRRRQDGARDHREVPAAAGPGGAMAYSLRGGNQGLTRRENHGTMSAKKEGKGATLLFLHINI